ncbi:MAG: hypothetical protein ACOZD0_10895 [Pseudomonadota bacterium]
MLLLYLLAALGVVAAFGALTFCLARLAGAALRRAWAALGGPLPGPTLRRAGLLLGWAVLAVMLPVQGCDYAQMRLYEAAIPPGLELGEVVYHDEQSDLREGCGLVVFRLQPATLERLRRDGLPALRDATQGRDGDGYHRYAAWQAGPAARDDDGPRLLRGWSCIDDEPTVLREVSRALDTPGAWFTTGHEQDLVIVPALGVLVYSFNG